MSESLPDDCKHENKSPYYFTGVNGIQGLVCDDCGKDIDIIKQMYEQVREARKALEAKG